MTAPETTSDRLVEVRLESRPAGDAAHVVINNAGKLNSMNTPLMA